VTSSPGGALSGAALFADVAHLQTASLLTQNFSFYGQDTWKLTPRLTAMYGLRWDINPPLKGKNSKPQSIAYRERLQVAWYCCLRFESVFVKQPERESVWQQSLSRRQSVGFRF
jgi:TonB dependent receptor